MAFITILIELLFGKFELMEIYYFCCFKHNDELIEYNKKKFFNATTLLPKA